MNDTLLIALVVAVIGPVILALITGWQRQKEKREDWRRQDAVAAEAKRQQDEVASKLLADNKVVAKTAKDTNSKLDTIHTLVNSNMTRAMQSELDSTMRELVGLKEIIELKKAAGKKPTKTALAAIKSTEDNISELRAALQDRKKQAKLVEAQEKLANGS